MEKKFIFPGDSIRSGLIRKMSEKAGGGDAGGILHTVVAVMELSHKVEESISQHFARYGLTQSRFLILAAMALNEDEEWTPAGLASLLGVRPPTVTGILTGLQSADLISTERSEKDRRVVTIRLTPKGRRKMAKILPDHFRRLTAAFSDLSENMNSFDALRGQIDRSLEILKGD